MPSYPSLPYVKGTKGSFFIFGCAKVMCAAAFLYLLPIAVQRRMLHGQIGHGHDKCKQGQEHKQDNGSLVIDKFRIPPAVAKQYLKSQEDEQDRPQAEDHFIIQARKKQAGQKQYTVQDQHTSKSKRADPAYLMIFLFHLYPPPAPACK